MRIVERGAPGPREEPPVPSDQPPDQRPRSGGAAGGSAEVSRRTLFGLAALGLTIAAVALASAEPTPGSPPTDAVPPPLAVAEPVFDSAEDDHTAPIPVAIRDEAGSGKPLKRDVEAMVEADVTGERTAARTVATRTFALEGGGL